MKKIEGLFTVSRADSSTTETKAVVTFYDPASCTGISAEVSLEDFAHAILGMSRQECTIEFSEISNFGKRREVMKLEFPCPHRGMAILDAEKACPEGWTVDPYFGSHSSFWHVDGVQWARTSAYRWINDSPPEEE